MYKQVTSPQQLVSKPKIIDVLDKGSGALIITEVSTYDQQHELVCYNQLSFFMVGSGNFGGSRSTTHQQIVQSEDVPTRAPDAVICQQTSGEQVSLIVINRKVISNIVYPTRQRHSDLVAIRIHFILIRIYRKLWVSVLHFLI